MRVFCSEFSSAARIWGHTYYKTRAAFTFPAKAAGMRQMGCAYRKAWLSDAQKVFYVHAFLGELTPAERRDLKDNPTFAYATQRSASGFLSPPRLWGLSIDKCAAASLFPRAAPRCRVKKAKARFCLFRELFFIVSKILHSTFYIYHLRRRVGASIV